LIFFGGRSLMDTQGRLSERPATTLSRENRAGWGPRQGAGATFMKTIRIEGDPYWLRAIWAQD